VRDEAHRSERVRRMDGGVDGMDGMVGGGCVVSVKVSRYGDGDGDGGQVR